MSEHKEFFNNDLWDKLYNIVPMILSAFIGTGAYIAYQIRKQNKLDWFILLTSLCFAAFGAWSFYWVCEARGLEGAWQALATGFGAIGGERLVKVLTSVNSFNFFVKKDIIDAMKPDTETDEDKHKENNH